MKTVIRRAATADAALLSSLNEDVQALHAADLPWRFKPAGPGCFPEESVAALLSQPETFALLAECDDEPVGYLYAEMIVQPETGARHAARLMHLHHISVRAGFRRLGIGGALVSAFKREAATRAILLLSTESWTFNEAARTFFRRHGFAAGSERLWLKTPLPPTPVLETTRLLLRPVAFEDAPVIQRRFAQWEVVRWLHHGIPWPFPEDGAATHLRGVLEHCARGEKFLWAIMLKDGPDELIGVVDLWPDRGTRDQRGFWLDPAFHGRGLMTEAVERVTEFVFLDLRWPELWLTNAAPNIASRRIKEKQGATLVDRQPARFVSGEGLREIWRLARADWMMQRAALRAGRTEDRSFCRRLQVETMRDILRALGIDEVESLARFERLWQPAGVRIITCTSRDIGCVATEMRDDSLFLGQFFIDPAYQGLGIGSYILRRLIAEAAGADKAVTLHVVKINPALRLYERLGFRIVGEEQHKFHMRREIDALSEDLPR